jgi:hypothetical protein
VGEDSDQGGGSRGGGTQGVTDAYDLRARHGGASARAVRTVRRFTDSSDLWKDTLDTLTACGVSL